MRKKLLGPTIPNFLPRNFCRLAIFPALLSVWLLLSTVAHAQEFTPSEELYVQVLLGMEPLTPALLVALDVNGDGFVGTADLVSFLIVQDLALPAVKFETGTSSIGEGAPPQTIRIVFSKPYTGTLRFSIDTMPISDNFDTGETPPRRVSAALDGDYRLSGADLNLGAADANGVLPGTIVLSDATEAVISIAPIDDADFERTERAIFYLEDPSAGDEYVRAAPYRHTVFINENDNVWEGVYLINSEQTDTPQDAPLATAAPLNFQLEFAQTDGVFVAGRVLSDGRGPIPASPTEASMNEDGKRVEKQLGWPLLFEGSGPDNFRATFSVPLAESENRFGIPFVREFELTAEAGDTEGLLDVFKRDGLLIGTIRETLIPMDEAFQALQTVQTGRFLLSFIPVPPDIVEDLNQ